MFTISFLKVKVLAIVCLIAHVCRASGAVDRKQQPRGVQELDAATFEALLAPSRDDGATLVEFYAPWCGNCKKVEPVLEELAKISADQDLHPLRVAKLDTTQYTQIGERLGITRYPTFKFFYRGQVLDFTGPRDVASMRATGRRLTSSAVSRAASVREADSHLAHDLVHFRLVAAPDIVMQGRDGSDVVNAFYIVADLVHPNASFIHVLDETASVPRVEKMEHGRDFVIPFMFDASTDRGVENQLAEFVRMNNHQYIASVDNSNFRVLGSWGKHVALAVLNIDSDDRHRELLRTFDAVATELRESIHSDLVLGVLNAERYAGFVKHFKAPAPSLLVLNMPHETFHLFSAEERIFEDRDALARAIRDAASADDVHGSGLSMKKISLHLGGGGSSRLQRAWRKLEQHYPWSAGLCLAPVVLLIVSIWAVPDPRRRKGDKQH